MDVANQKAAASPIPATLDGYNRVFTKACEASGQSPEVYAVGGAWDQLSDADCDTKKQAGFWVGVLVRGLVFRSIYIAKPDFETCFQTLICVYLSIPSECALNSWSLAIPL